MRAARGKPKRRGLTAAAVLVCLMVVTLVSGVLVKLGVAYRDQIRNQERRLQAELLAESGVDRAFARLAAKPDYTGERWEISAEALGQPAALAPEKGPSAVVTIRVDRPSAQGETRIVRVQADYPPDPPRRIRYTREVVVPKTP
jgi:hypothetical protein